MDNLNKKEAQEIVNEFNKMCADNKISPTIATDFVTFLSSFDQHLQNKNTHEVIKVFISLYSTYNAGLADLVFSANNTTTWKDVYQILKILHSNNIFTLLDSDIDQLNDTNYISNLETSLPFINFVNESSKLSAEQHLINAGFKLK